MGNDRARLRERARRLAVILVVASILAGVIAYGKQRVEHDLDNVVARLHHVDHQLDDARVAVKDAGARRRAGEAALDATIRRLQRERSTHREVGDLYRVITVELAQRRKDLNATSSDVELRARRLDQLNQCLTGVAQAMKEASYDANSRVVATLQSVADVCAAARGLTNGPPV